MDGELLDDAVDNLALFYERSGPGVLGGLEQAVDRL
jgi:hypothetical protein